MDDSTATIVAALISATGTVGGAIIGTWFSRREPPENGPPSGERGRERRSRYGVIFGGLIGLMVGALLIPTSSWVFGENRESGNGGKTSEQNRGEVIFKDDFSDPSSLWPTGKIRNGRAKFANDSYLVYDSSSSFEGTSPILYEVGNNITDSIVEVDASANTSNEGSYWGIICRAQYDGDPHTGSYRMMIRPDGGRSAIFKDDGGKKVTLKKDPYSAAIYQGSEPNHIRADCVGSKLTLHVNGEKLLEANDEEFDSGAVGLLVYSSPIEPPGVEVVFDNFKVSKPP